MTLTHVITMLIDISIVLIVCGLGLKTEKGDAIYLLSRPSLLLRSLASMNVVMAFVAVAIAVLFTLPFSVKLALVALAISPVPPILPVKQQRAGGSQCYAVSLLLFASLTAVVLAPVAVGLTAAFFGRDASIAPLAVAKIILISVIAPLLTGIFVRHRFPAAAQRLARPVSTIGTAVLIVAMLPVLSVATKEIWTIVGDGAVLALAAFAIVGLVVGHWLGGPEPENRTVLALATSTRHPGVALAIANLNFPDERTTFAIVLYHLAIGAIVSLPYVKWRRPAQLISPTG